MNETLTRLISGVVYVTLLIVATSYSTDSFYLLFGIFLVITIYEFCELIQIQKIDTILLKSQRRVGGLELSMHRVMS